MIAVAVLVMHHSNSSTMTAVAAAVTFAKRVSMAASSTLLTFAEHESAFDPRAIQSNMRRQSLYPCNKAEAARHASYMILGIALVLAVSIAAELLVLAWRP